MPRPLPSLALAVVLAVWGCAGYRQRVADNPYTGGLADVEQVDVGPSALGTRQLVVVATGSLPDPCTRIDQVEIDRFGTSFDVTLRTRRDAGALCAQILTPFRRRVLLPLEGRESGLFIVTVNGVRASFQIVPGGGRFPAW